MKYLLILLSVLMLFACTKEDGPTDPDSPNILLIIADDMGKDASAGFSEGSIKPNTPNLDKLKNEGLSFNNFWVNPTCSPTRASIITGKYGYRTGVKWANDELSLSETTLQQYLNEATNGAYATAIIGKWHLSGENTTVNPESFGIDHYAGLIRGAVQDYYQWRLTEDGTNSLQTEYITTVFTDLSIDWIQDQTQPWFLWLAYNAPHTPFHIPPANMHSLGDLPAYEDGIEPLPYYMAAIEAMDFQIGRLLEAIPEEERGRTLILFMGDNGTPNQVVQAPYASTKSKGSLYQGGVNVPLYASGWGVERTGEDNNLVYSTDLYSTITDIAGTGLTEIHDSQSFRPLLSSSAAHRTFQYAEMNNGTDDIWTISNGEYKLIVNANGDEELYDLATDPYENNNLLEGTLSSGEVNAKAALESELSTIRN